MNHISIEGMDGVGKSTTCKLLAERLGYIFVEKPLHYLLDDSDDEIKHYQKVAKRVNANPNRNFTAWYYGLNNIYLYEKFKDQRLYPHRAHRCYRYHRCSRSYPRSLYDGLR